MPTLSSCSMQALVLPSSGRACQLLAPVLHNSWVYPNSGLCYTWESAYTPIYGQCTLAFAESRMAIRYTDYIPTYTITCVGGQTLSIKM